MAAAELPGECPKRDLMRTFGARRDLAREHMERVAKSLPADVLDAEAFHLYE